MKVFISWSGTLSHSLALTLREWLPSVLQAVEPYVSSEDIDKGTRWSSDIAKELEESSFGIICVTPDNLQAPWINFEAGALSKALNKSYVCPLLYNIKKAEIKGPLLQFQSTVCEKEDIKKLINSVNSACNDLALDPTRFDKIYDVWWPKLDEELQKLDKIPAKSTDPKPVPVSESLQQQILEEILEICRNQYKLLRSPDEILPPSYLISIIRESLPSYYHPQVWADLERCLQQSYEIRAKIRDKQDIVAEEIIQMCEMLENPLRYLSRKGQRHPLHDDFISTSKVYKRSRQTDTEVLR